MAAVAFIEGAVAFVEGAVTFIKGAVIFIGEGAVISIEGVVMFIGGAMMSIDKGGSAIKKSFKTAGVKVDNIKGVNKYNLKQWLIIYKLKVPSLLIYS